MKTIGRIVALLVVALLSGFIGGVTALTIHDVPERFLDRDWHGHANEHAGTRADDRGNAAQADASAPVAAPYCEALSTLDADLQSVAAAFRESGDEQAAQSFSDMARMKTDVAAAMDDDLCRSSFSGALSALTKGEGEIAKWRALAAATGNLELDQAANRVENTYGVSPAQPKPH